MGATLPATFVGRFEDERPVEFGSPASDIVDPTTITPHMTNARRMTETPRPRNSADFNRREAGTDFSG
jgi:hypothetical protein